MAKKSKTQRAKASARRAEKKAMAEATQSTQEVVEVAEEEKKGKLFSRKAKEEKPQEKQPASEKTSSKKIAKSEKKETGVVARFENFIKAVRSEMRRVTWPSRQDVIRWSGVVVMALIFFSLYVFVLDNFIVTQLLLAISGLGA